MIIRIKTGRIFEIGVTNAKLNGGKYNPSTRTWTLPDTVRVRKMLEKPAAYGWVIAAKGPAVMPCPRCRTYCDGDCSED